MKKNNQIHSRVLWLTRTAVLVAVLITLQWATSGTQAFAGQYITGSLVNCVLAISALFAGLYSGLTVAILSPFFAFVLGVGPKFLQIVPCIALGNAVFVTVLFFLGRKADKLWKQGLCLASGALAKFFVLYLAVVQVVLPIMGEQLKAPQIKTFTAMFSWPQLVTALLGGLLAFLLLPILKKAMKKV